MKNIFFDWSGVVKDATKSQLWVVNKIFNKFGAEEISLEEMRENWEQPYMLFYKKYLPEMTKEEQDAAYKEAVSRSDYPGGCDYPGMVELIKEAKAGNNFLAVISSDLPETLLGEVQRYGLEGVFDEIIMKIHDKTQAIESLVERNNLDRSKTFFIGDSNHEIEAGKKVGVKTIAVTWGFNTEKDLRKRNPDFLVNSVEELRDILL